MLIILLAIFLFSRNCGHHLDLMNYVLQRWTSMHDKMSLQFAKQINQEIWDTATDAEISKPD